MSFKINRVYTRSGDDGKTGLVGGARVSKASTQVKAYGEIDELNSLLGVVRSLSNESTQKLAEVLDVLQQELFDVGAQVASEPDSIPDSMWTVDDASVSRLEDLCDQFGKDLPELSSFIIPGGTQIASYLHLARTVCRRAERSLTALRDEQRAADRPSIPDNVLAYTNRLSDALFVFARWALAAEGVSAPLWTPAGKR